MKKLLVIAFILSSFSVLAQRTVLSASEKDILKENLSFKTEVKWALLNQAQYWVGLDQTGTATQAQRERWAKSRLFAHSLIASPSNAEGNEYVMFFLLFLKNVQVRAPGEFDPAETVSYMVSQGIFESLADQTFDLRIKQIGF